MLGLQNLEAAQDIVQDTLLQAMNTWGYKGIPENPSGWLYRVAKIKPSIFCDVKKNLKRSVLNIPIYCNRNILLVQQ
jgi:RNA polymerase sigma-70 factor (ECF subfamily)